MIRSLLHWNSSTPLFYAASFTLTILLSKFSPVNYESSQETTTTSQKPKEPSPSKIQSRIYPLKDSMAIKGSSVAFYPANHPIEDRHFFTTNHGDCYFGVLDGHGGWQLSNYASKYMLPILEKEMKLLEKDSSKSMAEKFAMASTNTFEKIDQKFKALVTEPFQEGFVALSHLGACALLVMIHSKSNTLVVANAGDCRAIIASKNEPIQLSNDHNINSIKEQQLLASLHPNEENLIRCRRPNSCYIKGRLQPSRSLGDYYLKDSKFNPSDRRFIPAPYTPPYIQATPEITSYTLTPNDQFIVIGSDGLWEALSNEEVIDIVAPILEDQQFSMEEACEIASQTLISKVLKNAAKRHHLTLEQLYEIPPGKRERRRFHDDITVFVVSLKVPNELTK